MKHTISIEVELPDGYEPTGEFRPAKDDELWLGDGGQIYSGPHAKNSIIVRKVAMCIDLKKVFDEVCKICEESRDKVYKPFNKELYSYVADSTGKGRGHGCLIGKALVSIYPELYPVLEEYDTEAVECLADILPYEGYDVVGLEYVEILTNAQKLQDEGKKWGEVFDECLQSN